MFKKQQWLLAFWGFFFLISDCNESDQLRKVFWEKEEKDALRIHFSLAISLKSQLQQLIILPLADLHFTIFIFIL